MNKTKIRIVLHLCNVIITIELYLASITWISTTGISEIADRFIGLALSTLLYALLFVAIEYLIEGE